MNVSETDLELVRRYRGGDENAAGDILTRHAAYLLRVAQSRFTGSAIRASCDSGEAIVSGLYSFLRTVKKPGFDETKSNIVGLLTRIVQRKCLVQMRRMRPHSCGPESFDLMLDEMLISPSSTKPTADVFAALNDSIDRVRAGMTPLEQRIIGLWTDECAWQTLSDIAETCGCSVDAVNSALRRFGKLLSAEIDVPLRRQERRRLKRQGGNDGVGETTDSSRGVELTSE